MATRLDAELLITAGVDGLKHLDNLIGRIDEAGGNTDQLREEAARLRQEFDNLSTDQQAKRLHNLANAANNSAKDMGLLGKSAQKLKEDLSEADKAAKELSDAKITLGIANDEQVKQKINDVGVAYRKLKDSGTLSSKELARASELHKVKVQELEGQLKRAKPALDDVAMGVGKIVTASAGLASVAKQAVDFEAAMAGVRKVVDGTPEEMAQLGQQVKELAHELGIVPNEVAEIVAQGGQLGVAFKDLPEFTLLAGQMAKAFGMTASEAANAAAKMTNIFGLPLNGVRELGDAINTLGNNTAATEAQITETLLRIGGTAKQFGLAADQAAALADGFIALGKSPEVAATAINALLNKLQAAPAASDEFKNTLLELGISADQLAQNIQDNPQKALTDFMASLSELDNQQRTIVLNKLFGQEYADDIALATGSLGVFNKAFDLIANKQQNAGAMQEEFAAAMDNSSAKIEQAKIAVTNLAITLGNELLPIIASVADGVGGAIDAVNDFAEAHPMITRFAVLLTSAKVGIFAVQQALKVMGVEGKLALTQISTGAVGATGSLRGLATQAGLTAASMTSIGGTTRTLKGDVVGLGKQLTTLNGILSGLVAFDVGWDLGTWLRDSSDSVAAIGDKLGRGLAYIDAIFTDRTFADVNEFYKTEAELARESAEQKRITAEAAKAQAEAEKKAAEEAAIAAEKQAAAEKERLASIATEYNKFNAELQAQKAALEALEQAGEQGSNGYNTIKQSVQSLSAQMHYLKQQMGDSLSAFDEHAIQALKAEQALESLGLTAEQVQTGISASAKSAIDNFKVAAVEFGDDADAMARLYKAAMAKMSSEEELQALEDGFEEVAETMGKPTEAINKLRWRVAELGESSRVVFEKLGVDIDAVSTGIGSKAREAFESWSMLALQAGQDGEKSALKIQAAFNETASTLHTPQEFKKFNEVLNDTGYITDLTKDQVKLLGMAMNGDVEAATKLAQSMAEFTRVGKTSQEAVKANNKALAESAQKKQQDAAKSKEMAYSDSEAAKAKEESADASEKAADAKEKEAAASKKSADATKQDTEAKKENKQISMSVFSLSGLAASAVKKISAAYQKAANAANEYFRTGNIGIADNANRLNEQARALEETTRRTINATAELNAKVSDGTVTMRDIARAASAARSSMVSLDKTTLNNLNAALDAARQKIANMRLEAQDAAAAIEAQIADLDGDDSKTAKLQQERKLRELNLKLQEAERANNDAAVVKWREAISLQKELYNKQRQKAQEQKREREQQEKERQKQERQREQQRQPTPSTPSTTPSATNDMYAGDVVDAFNERIEAAKRQAKQEAKQELAQELIDGAKRSPYS